MDIELVEKNRSTEPMDDHRDLTMFIEWRLEKLLDMLSDEKEVSIARRARPWSYLGIANHIHLA